MKARLLKRIDDELQALERERTRELPKEIQRARELGDLRENAEYQAAKERQRLVEARIGMLQTRRSEIALMNLDRLPHDRAALGSTVLVRDLRAADGATVTYELVMPEDADPAKGVGVDRVPDRAGHRRPRGRRRDEGKDAERGSRVRDHQADDDPRILTGSLSVDSIDTVRRYIPQLRTALVLAGTGTAGAYHAGVLRSLVEAGVKIDLVAGRGIGAAGAMFAAVDGGARLWGRSGLWRSRGVRRAYGWRPTLRGAAWMLAAAFAATLLPVAALAVAVVVFPLGYFLALVGVEAGAALSVAYGDWLRAVFAPSVLPVYLPRLAVIAVASLFALLVLDAIERALRPGTRRLARGGLWWRLLGAPIDRAQAVAWFSGGLWQIMHGARIQRPTNDDLGQRYAELLVENLGQPGFRELLMLVHDIDARRDVAFALLAEPYRAEFLQGRPGAGRRGATARDGRSGARRATPCHGRARGRVESARRHGPAARDVCPRERVERRDPPVL